MLIFYGHVTFRATSNLSVERVKIFHVQNFLFTLVFAYYGK